MSRLIPTTVLFFTILMMSCAALAGTGWCKPQNGPSDYDFYVDATLHSIESTHVGDTFLRSWNSGNTYSAMCDTTPGLGSWTYYKATPGSANTDIGVIGNEHYYLLAGTDDYLSVSTNITIVDASSGSGESTYNVPFADKSNHMNAVHNPVSGNINDCPSCLNWGSGSKGNIKLRVEKRITAPQIIIPAGTVIATLYASHTLQSYGPDPMSFITIGGTITVPQGCELNVGDTITITLPDAWANDFKTVGQIPQNYTPVTKDVEIHCSNVAMAQELRLGLRATPSTSVPNAIQSSNENIGVMISVQTPSAPEQVIRPNDSTSRIPFYLDNDNGFAHVMLQAWPVKTKDVTPAPGLFTARATLDVYYP
ncbi:fimbrial protein [Citrobacter sp. U14242]|uniref:fimbrial protein n=1 Tax=Citrobacter sp. U14242 TaxID=3390192 RepID=UPI00397BDCCD